MITLWSNIAASWLPMDLAIVLSAIRWQFLSCAGSDNASPQLMRSSVKLACGGNRDQTCAKTDEVAYLPTSARRKVASCLRRFVAETVQLAFDSVTPVQVLRMAGCGRRCEALERAVHKLSVFTAGNVANDRSWFHCRTVASASFYIHLSDRCFHRAPFLLYFPCSPSVTRSVLIPRPADSELLLFLDSSPNQVRWVPTPENAALALGAGHTRVASRRSVPRAIRANTTKEKNNGDLRKQDHSERLPR